MFKRYKVELSPEVYCAVLVNWYVKYISLLLNIVCNVAIYNSIRFLSLKEGSCCSGKWKQSVTLYWFLSFSHSLFYFPLKVRMSPCLWSL